MADVAPLPAHRVVPIGEITPAEENPRKIPQSAVDATARSIENFGWKQAIVVDENMVIVAGHTRRLAALKLGLTEVPIIDAKDLSPEQVKAYRIMDNRTGDYSVWDMPELVQQLDELDQLGFGDVLGLADWEQVMDGYSKHLQPESDAEDLTSLQISPEASTYMEGGWEIGVVFSSMEAALAAEKHLIELEGVVDVRHKR